MGSYRYDLNCKAKELAEWVHEIDEIPKAILLNDKILLKRFIYSSNGDLERAKKKILLNYKLRRENVKLFLERDPLSEETQNTYDVCDLILMPELTEENHQIVIIRLNDYDVNKFIYNEQVKLHFMLNDSVAGTPHKTENEMVNGEIRIFDMKGASLRYLLKTVYSTLQVFMRYEQEATPIPTIQIHVINSPFYINRFVSIVKPMMSSYTQKILHFHKSSENLFEYISPKLLPNEYGGSAGTLKDLKNQTMKKIENNRKYLTEQDNWIVNETIPNINSLKIV